MRILFEALRGLLIDNLPAVQAVAPLVATDIHIGHISELADPQANDDVIGNGKVTLYQQGGNSVLPVAGWETSLVIVQVWTRRGAYAAMQMYDWVSYTINQRRSEITCKMQTLPDSGAPPGSVLQGVCYTFYRQWKTGPLYDDRERVWYVTARYFGQTADFADLHAAWDTGTLRP